MSTALVRRVPVCSNISNTSQSQQKCGDYGRVCECLPAGLQSTGSMVTSRQIADLKQQGVGPHGCLLGFAYYSVVLRLTTLLNQPFTGMFVDCIGSWSQGKCILQCTQLSGSRTWNLSGARCVTVPLTLLLRTYIRPFIHLTRPKSAAQHERNGNQAAQVTVMKQFCRRRQGY